MAQNYGSTVKNLTLTFLLKLFFGSSYICSKSPTWSVDFKTHDSHTDCRRHCHGNPTAFLKIDKNPKKYFSFKLKTSKKHLNKYMSKDTYSQHYFIIFLEFLIFLYFSRFSWWFFPKFQKKLYKILQFCYTIVKILIFHEIVIYFVP